MRHSEWKEVQINEIAKIRGRIGWKGYKTSDLRETGPVVLGGNNIKSSIYLDLSDVKHLSREKFEESPEIMLKRNDILIVTRGNGIGDVGFFNGSLSEATINPSMVILSECTETPKFLFYYLISNKGREKILSVSSGSSIPAIYQKSLSTIKCMIPPLAEQRAIADTLSCLDDKIELNNRINKTLEEMAQTIFKSWFVDFEPFQDRDFEDSELGRIPKGWRVGTVENICTDIFSGGTPSTSKQSYWNGNVPWLSSGETRDSIIIETEKTITTEGIKNSSTRLAKKHDIVIASAGQGHTRGQTSITLIDTYINQSVVALRGIENSTGYLYCNLRSRYSELRAISDSSSIRGSLTTKAIKKIPILLPPSSVLSDFQEKFASLLELCGQLRLEKRNLSKIRDALLPKLMSGEIRVPLEEVQ